VTGLLWDGYAGGKISVPDALYGRFLRHYAADVSSGEWFHCISEQRSPVFRMLIDNDFVEPECTISGEGALELARLYQQETARYFALPDGAGRARALSVVVLRSQREAAVSVDGRAGVKTGLHFVFPWLMVDAHRALMLREAYLLRLEREYGPRTPPRNAWGDVVDPRVYISNGLRMPYSIKWEPCPACHNRREVRASCDTCRRTGKVTDGRFYAPLLFVAGDGRVSARDTQRLKENRYAAVQCTSIRASLGTAPTPGWAPPAGAPMYDLHALAPGRGGRALAGGPRPPPGAPLRLQSGPATVSAAAGRIAVPRDCERFRLLVEYVRAAMHPAYQQIEGKDMYCNPACTYYVLRTQGPGSRFCQNKVVACPADASAPPLLWGAEHTSATVYFYVTPAGISQKCWSRKATLHNRRYGYCKDFESLPRQQLPVRLLSLLFGRFIQDKGALERARRAAFLQGGPRTRALTRTLDLCDRLTRVGPRCDPSVPIRLLAQQEPQDTGGGSGDCGRDNDGDGGDFPPGPAEAHAPRTPPQESPQSLPPIGSAPRSGVRCALQPSGSDPAYMFAAALPG
jgi:hypothetical protein